VFYESWKNVISELTKDVQLEIYQAITEYAINGNLIELKPIAKVAFSFIKQDLDRDAKAYIEKCNRNRDNAKKGGAPKGNKNAQKTTETTERLKKQPKQPDNDNDNESTNVDIFSNSDELLCGSELHDEQINFKNIVDYFNRETKGVFGEVRYPLSDVRKGLIRARIREHGKDGLKEVFHKAASNSFLKGDSGKFKATFDWLIRPTNFEKVLTGNYDERKKQESDTVVWDFDTP